MSPSTGAKARHHGALFAGLLAVALLALLTTWSAALARVPQQRAAVERLLRAQTGLDVRYAGLAVRLGFYGPEAEFSNVEMRRPGAAAPLLRAPRMVARFESWRLLRGGQLRPGRVLVSGAELDLRQLLELRRGTAPVVDAPAAPRSAATTALAELAPPRPTPADAGPLAELESRLPRLLAGIPEGSLDFEAVTLLWSDATSRDEPLLLRAPRLHASRRIDGAQLSGTLLLPARFGRTLFVAAQLRDAGAAHGGLQGRVRISGRGLLLARWRDAGVLPDWVGGGVGDLAFAAQLRDGQVLHADGEARLTGLGFATPALLRARRFGVAAAEFSYDRLPGARRYQLLQVEMTPRGGSAPAFGERGSLELRLGAGAGAGLLRARRIPVELLGFLAQRAGQGAWPGTPPLQVSGGKFEEFDATWPAARARVGPGADGTDAALERVPTRWHGKLVDLALGSADGSWSLDGVAASVTGEGGHLQLALQARDRVLRSPWLEPRAAPPRLSLSGEVTLGATPAGWSAVLERLELAFAEGPQLRLSGAAGSVAAPQAADEARAAAAHHRPERDSAPLRQGSALQVALVAPWPRERMALLQQLLAPWLAPAFWQRFGNGRLESASAEFVAGRLQSARAALRGAQFAAEDPLPEARELAVDLAWDADRLEGQARGGRVGPLTLESGRLAWSAPAAPAASTDRTPRLEVEAQLAGTLREAFELSGAAALPASALAELDGRARIAARWRAPAGELAAARARALELSIDVTQARWRVLPGAAPFEGLEGRLRADGRGLRDGQLEGRWLGGPVDLRLDVAAPGGLRVAASGRLERAALQREWAWVELVERSRRDTIDWTADARLDPDAPLPPPDGAAQRRTRSLAANDVQPPLAATAAPWRVRVALPGSARAELRWVPAAGAWRLDHGTVQFGDGAAIAGIPGALVVGGRIERLDLAGLAGALDGAAGSGGWQRPLVGEVAVDELDLGATHLGAARLRLAGSRESSSIDLDGAAVAGELRQRHDERGLLRARFARLRLPTDAPLSTLPLAAGALRGTIDLQIADLRRGARSLGELVATITVDDAAVATRDLALRRGAQRLGASGRCDRATLACSVEIALAGAELGALQRDLGHAPRLQGRQVTALGQLQWTMAPGGRFAAGLQGKLELSTTLDADVDRGAARDGSEPAAAAASEAEPDDGSTWPLLAPLLAVATRQADDAAARGNAVQAAADASSAAAGSTAGNGASRASGTSGTSDASDANAAVAASAASSAMRTGDATWRAAGAAPFERLDVALAFTDGVAEIERYEAVGRDARLSVAGSFDFRRGTLEQQADWYWIAPGVSGAVERLDPRSPLAAGLRSLRELLARTPQNAATRGAPSAARPGTAERFLLEGSLQQPRVERPPLLDSAQ